ncbi:MAG: hypothetical protein QG620_149 [Patescibacteria group bacterium]|nr:hypothetical protein [Patescibacteria group bacterium]
MAEKFSIAISPYLRLKTFLLSKCPDQRVETAPTSDIGDPKQKQKIFY